MKKIIDQFCDFIGMEINWNKSRIVFSKSTQNMEVLMRIVGFNPINFSVNYLGLPLVHGILKHRECGGLISSLKRTLA